MTNKALIVVDYSYDFIVDDGQLTCGKPGQNIEQFTVEGLSRYQHQHDNVFFMMGLHFEGDPYHPETKLFPPHNIEGISGRQLYGKVKSFLDKYKNEDTVHHLDKRRYDSLYDIALDSLLRERHIGTVEIVGVCTDMCVLHTAIFVYNLGYHIIIPEQGVASFNEEGHQFALAHSKNSLGVKAEVTN